MGDGWFQFRYLQCCFSSERQMLERILQENDHPINLMQPNTGLTFVRCYVHKFGD